MEKIQFKNLPDTSTPLSAENLNKLQDNIEKSTAFVGVQQPQNQEIWFKKSNNIFDGKIELGNIDIDTGALLESENRTRSANFTKVSPNTQYTMTTEEGQYRWIIGYTENKIGITDGNYEGHPATIITTGERIISFRTTSTTQYIKWYDTRNTNINEKVQIEKGGKATPYKPYANNEILTKSGNEYENFDVSNCEVSYYEPKGKQVWFKKSSNLLKQPYSILTNEETINGVNIKVNKDYSITLNGKSSAETFYNFTSNDGLFTENIGVQLNPYTQNNHTIKGMSKNTGLGANPAYNIIYLYFKQGIEFKNETLYPMVILGKDNQKGYEPYSNNDEILVNTGESFVPFGMVESGSNENGNWIKFQDGTLICTKKIVGKYSATTPWGSLYETSAINLGNYAMSFIEKPIISGSLEQSGLIEALGAGKTNTSFGVCIIASSVLRRDFDLLLDLTAIGRWK